MPFKNTILTFQLLFSAFGVKVYIKKYQNVPFVKLWVSDLKDAGIESLVLGWGSMIGLIKWYAFFKNIK